MFMMYFLKFLAGRNKNFDLIIFLFLIQDPFQFGLFHCKFLKFSK